MSIDTLPPPPPPRPDGPATLRQRFIEVAVTNDVGDCAADAAWHLVLDAWRVIEVASARADVPATPSRDEWMAALRVAISRADHGAHD